MYAHSGRRLLVALACFLVAAGFALLRPSGESAPTHAGPPAAPRPVAGLAHPAPSVIHDYLVRIGADEAQVFLRLAVSPPLIPQVYRQIDSDGDGVTSAQERQAWLDRYLANMRFTVDDHPAAFHLLGASTVDQRDFVASMRHPVTVTLQVTFALPADAKGAAPADHHFILNDNTNYVGYDEYYSSWEDDPGAVTTSHDLTNAANPATFEAVFNLDPSTAAAPAAPAAAAPPQETAGSLFLDQLDTFLRNPAGDTAFGMLLFVFAVGLGGLHALTPGHGKAVVAAYLVGTRGRVRDAVALGSIVTFTHTISVVALGLALLALNNFILPRWLQPALEVASGLLIVVIGLGLFVSRLYTLRTGRPFSPLGSRRPAAEAAPDHAHDHDHPHTHDHAHPHDHAHGHDHGPGGHSHAPRQGASARDLLALGVSGGLVPCPDALAILLLTAPVRQIGLGLGLVSSFSLGLAAVLIAIGVLMVRGRGLLERLLPGGVEGNPRWVRALPVVSAVVVVVLGVVLVMGAVVGQKWV
jgi:nickel/cobalt transporter (NicO) family protein